MLLKLMINILHLLLVLFAVLAPFTNRPGILLLHISYSLSLLVHWYFNDNSCCLTILESTITGSESNNTFMHKIVSPMYDISESRLSKLVWLFTIALLILSSYKMYKYISSLETVTIQSLFDTNSFII